MELASNIPPNETIIFCQEFGETASLELLNSIVITLVTLTLAALALTNESMRSL